MQTALLPASICEAIDKEIRDFISGSVEGCHKIHNINWEMVCKPKELRGLGLRSTRELNKAFLMNMVWGIMVNPSFLWAKVIISKCMVRTANSYALARKSVFSTVWRGLVKVWPEVENGLQWSIRDGKNTKFWTDLWMDSGIILIDHALNIQGVNCALSVSEVCYADGVWNIEFLYSTQPHDVILQIVRMSVSRPVLGNDTLAWRLEAKGKFSVKSAYLLLKGIQSDAPSSLWHRLWEWKGPNKVHHFFWLSTHNYLMTNWEPSSSFHESGVLPSMLSPYGILITCFL
ncbi:Putative ribonuclease H protein At1g65750 [Linum perenne]